MYYRIEVINNISIDFIVFVVTKTKTPKRIAAGILVSNINPDSHFVLAELSKREIGLENNSKPNKPRKYPRKIIAD